MTSDGLSALVFYSPNPARLARFFNDTLGIPFAPSTHDGVVGEHLEATFQRTHFAIWRRSPGAAPAGESPIVPTFRVADLDAHLAALSQADHPPTHPPIDLGEGKRVVTFLDPDGNRFRLIELPGIPRAVTHRGDLDP